MEDKLNRAKVALHGLLIPAALVLLAIGVVQLTVNASAAGAGEPNEGGRTAEGNVDVVAAAARSVEGVSGDRTARSGTPSAANGSPARRFDANRSATDSASTAPGAGGDARARAAAPASERDETHAAGTHAAGTRAAGTRAAGTGASGTGAAAAGVAVAVSTADPAPAGGGERAPDGGNLADAASTESGAHSAGTRRTADVAATSSTAGAGGFRSGTGAARSDALARHEHVDTVAVRPGDTLLRLLYRGGLSHDEAMDVAEAIAPLYNPARLRPGQEIRFVSTVTGPPNPGRYPAHMPGIVIPFEAAVSAAEGGASAERAGAAGSSARALPGPDRIEIVTSVENRIIVRRTPDGVQAEEIANPLETRESVASGTIVTSLYGAGRDAGLSNNLLMQLIDLLAFEVDFQREFHPGDSFRVLYEQHFSRQGEPIRTGNLLAAEVELRHRTIRMYRFKGSNGRADYFDEAGTTIRKTLLRTPIDGARITSGYGYRRHPVRGYSHLHRGVDFAGPVGTPVYAAGSGQVERLRFTQGFGNHMVLRHRNGYKTLYAHMNGFARGMHTGKTVEQGQLIGFLGNTGMSTGPHLHYEVYLNGVPVNPASLSFPPERSLTGSERRSFDAARDALDRILFGRKFDRPVITN